jgi:peptidoglycan/LPS O-acetylase OafA/YrhL
VILASFGSVGGTVTGWGILAEVVSYTNYYIAAFGRDGLPPATTQLWSLGLEEHYYLAIPLVIGCFWLADFLEREGWPTPTRSRNARANLAHLFRVLSFAIYLFLCRVDRAAGPVIRCPDLH